MRFTPAGIEVFEAVLHHRSEVVEAGKVRAEIQFKGFLAPKSMRTRRLTVHITEFK